MRLGLTVLMLMAVGVAPLWAQSAEEEILRSVIFSEVDKVREAAIAARADLYAPGTLSRAEELYVAAQRELANGRKLDRIRPRLEKATAEFRSASNIAAQATETLAAMIKSRNDAAGVDAASYDESNWRNGQRAYDDAISFFERGREKQALSRAADAEERFRAAELTAIKAAYLNEARRLLAEADENRADRLAPRTFARATSLLDAAETSLSEDRYDVDRPRDLARQAQYEAAHAIYLADQVDTARKERTELEDLILAGEAPLQAVAGTLNLKVGFDTGYQAATDMIQTAIGLQQDRIRELEQDLFDRENQVEALRAQLVSLEERFGSIASERQALEQQLAAQARRRDLFRHAESLFIDDDADVLSAGDAIIIRLTGDVFAVGTVQLQPGTASLLDRVINAIRLYGDPTVRIEGHTDSFGGDSVNLTLSQERANAILSFLVQRLPPEEVRIDAVGFGETRPIANNDTREGRERNRRIDVIIYPTF
ncbi:MAG: OmpA family protein [Gammaproteobacteria bacterium]|nr:OmpA family protein [Gammaproteobacteria bacterium]NND58973.1 OmpA family protein [Gammaproteobacteria bacterium]